MPFVKWDIFVIWDVTKVPNSSADVFCKAIDKENESFLVIVPCEESDEEACIVDEHIIDRMWSVIRVALILEQATPSSLTREDIASFLTF